MASSFSRKAIIDDGALRTFFQGFLGATTFGAYNHFVVIEPMRQTILEQKKIIDDQQKMNDAQKNTNEQQKKMIERLETKLNSHWW